jgi:chromosomal replication initiation ATPase DnaA
VHVPTQKLPDTLVQDILRLAAEDMDAASIARELNLLRMEVAAILAHQTIGSAVADAAGDTNAAATEDEWREVDTEGVDEPMSVSLEQNEPEDSVGEIYIGEELEYPNPAYWNPSDSKVVQNPHLMIMGESGSGKTYAAQCIVAELARAGILAAGSEGQPSLRSWVDTLGKQCFKPVGSSLLHIG